MKIGFYLTCYLCFIKLNLFCSLKCLIRWVLVHEWCLTGAILLLQNILLRDATFYCILAGVRWSWCSWGVELGVAVLKKQARPGHVCVAWITFSAGYSAAEFGDLPCSLTHPKLWGGSEYQKLRWYGFISPTIRDWPFLELLAGHRCLVVTESLAGNQSLVGKETGSSVGVGQAVVLHHMQTWFQ